MRIASLSARELVIPFNGVFRHAAARRAATSSVWVVVRTHEGAVGYGEGCPRPYVTGESVASALRDVDSLREWVSQRREAIDANPTAWTAVELAVLDALGKIETKPLESLLGTRPLAGRFRYTAVLDDDEPDAFDSQLRRYLHAGFRDFKVKLVGDVERDRAKVRALLDAGVAADAVRADANNCWSGDADALRDLRRLPLVFAAYEEPVRAGRIDAMRRIAVALARPIVLDESVCRAQQIACLADDAMRWIVNVRVAKMGGLIRSLETVESARRAGVRIIVGAHVGETSVLTRAALAVASAARDITRAHEGAFGTHLLTRDVAQPSLAFGPGGILDTDTLRIGQSPGLGLAIVES